MTALFDCFNEYTASVGSAYRVSLLSPLQCFVLWVDYRRSFCYNIIDNYRTEEQMNEFF